MKKLIAWLLLITLTLGLFAGCRKTEVAETTEPDTTISEADIEGINAAIDYLKNFYKDDGSETPVDYERFGIVRIGGVPYEVVWTVDVSEDLIKIVVNDDGTVTIDVNEDCEEDTPYVLTATITDAAGNTVSHSWNYILPKAVDMVAIVKAAYALKPGESLPYESTLRGKITAIKTPYSDEYKNITVVIEVEGAEDMPIECYRLKGEGVEELCVGDIITVKGTLKNYNGTIEFDSGCVLIAVIPGERVQAPDDMKQIVDEAYALGANKTLPYEATLTGEITEIGQAYDSYYGNITVTIEVEGREGYPIVCYRLKGSGCENLKVTDIITVKGYITNYVGSQGRSTIEFTAGCQLLSYTPGPGVYAPTDPAEIMRIAKNLGANKKTKFEATLTGVVTEINSAYSSQYENISVTMDVNGTSDEIYCYRIKGTGASTIEVGDTITVKGYIMNYVGDSGYSTIEFVAGSKLLKVVKGVKEELPSYNNIIATAPVVGKAYKLGTEQGNLAGDPWLYFNGKQANSYYMGTSEDGRKAVDVYLAQVSGGYNLYFKDASGATKYINIVQKTVDGSVKTNISIDSKASTVYTFNTEYNTLVTKLADGEYYIGTYNQFSTMSASSLSKISGSFPAHLLTLEALTGPASLEEAAKKLQKEYPDGYDADKKLPASIKVRDDVFNITWKLETANTAAVKIVNGKVVETSQEQAVIYKLIATITKKGSTESTTVSFEHTVAPIAKEYVKNPVVGTPYKLGMNLITKTVLFNGTGSGTTFRLNTIDDSTKAVDVYLENAGAAGRYYLYFMNEGVKTYIRLYDATTSSSKNPTGGLEFVTEKPSEYYTYDKNWNTLVYTKGENSFFMGTYGTFETVSASSTYYISGDNAANVDVSQYLARFYPQNVVITPPEELPEPDKDTLTIAEAIALGESKGNDKYTTNKYKVTGKITELKSDKYGNMYISDNNGNSLYIYGLYSEDGKTRYDSLSVKPGVGDTITVYGVIGKFNGTPQMKNVWAIGYHAAEEQPTDPNAPTTPGETVEVLKPVAEPVIGTAYKLALQQNNLDGDPILGFTGKMAYTYYFGLSKAIDEMVDVKLEAADGGYYLYFMEGTTKTYLDIVPRDGTTDKVNVVMQTSGTHTVYELNTEYKYISTAEEINGAQWYLGSYGTKDSISASGVSRITEGNESTIGVSQFCAWFYEVSEETPDPTEPTPSEPAPSDPSAPVSLENGDQVVIYAPAYNKALSADKVDANSHYNKGVDITVSDGTVSGYTDAEVWTVTKNADGSYSFANGGQNIGMADSFASMNLGEVNDDWNVISLGGSLYNIKNVVRGNFMEWYASKTNWSTYNSSSAATDDQFQMSFYVIGKGILEEESAPSEPTPSEPTPSEPTPSDPSAPVSLETGDEVVIFAPAYNKALSAEKVDASSFYNKGVDVTVTDGTLSGYTDAEVWTVTKNADGSYSFANGGQNIGMADQYGSMSQGAVNDDWTVISLGNGLYHIQNVVRKNYMEWFAEKNNWSTYSTATGDLFQMSFYVIGKGILQDETDTPSDPSDPSDPSGIGKISDVLAANSGEFTVKGVVTCVDGSNIYVQDATGAICVRMSEKPTDIALGDTIIGTGSRADYNGMPQLGSGTYEKSSGMKLTAKEVTIGGLTTADICTYVKLSGVEVTEVYDNNGQYTNPNITVKDAEGNTIQLYKAVVTSGSVKVGDKIDITCAVGYHNKYQLRNTLATEVTVVTGEEPVEPNPSEPETSEPSGESTGSKTYAFSSYGEGVQYANEQYDLDENVKLDITDCHMKTQLRIYQDATHDGIAVVTSTKAITGLSIKAGHKVATLNVYGSNDGTNWELIQGVSITNAGTTSDPEGTYLTYDVDFGDATYTYLKLDAVGAQIRLVSMTLTFAESTRSQENLLVASLKNMFVCLSRMLFG